MSEYLELIKNIDNLEFLTREVWLKNCYNALQKIRKEEDYNFFKMNKSIKKEIKYYTNNEEELQEIITILNPEYSIYAYHNILDTIIQSNLAPNDDLEYLMFKK